MFNLRKFFKHFKFIISLYMYVCFICVYMCASHCSLHACGCQKRVLDHLEQERHMNLTFHMDTRNQTEASCKVNNCS